MPNEVYEAPRDPESVLPPVMNVESFSRLTEPTSTTAPTLGADSSTEVAARSPEVTENIQDVTNSTADACYDQVNLAAFRRATSAKERVEIANRIATSNNTAVIFEAFELSTVGSKEGDTLIHALLRLKACDELAEAYFYLDHDCYLAGEATRVIATHGSEAAKRKALHYAEDDEARDMLRRSLLKE